MLNASQNEDIAESEYLFKLKREDIEAFIKKNYGAFDKETVKVFIKALNTKFLVKIPNEMLLPNICIIKRSEVMNLTALYTNNFKYVINKHKRWDKDIIIITN